MISHIINILSAIASFLFVNNNNLEFSVSVGVLSSVITVIISFQQGLTNMLQSNNKTLNQNVTELKNNQNIVVQTTTAITPTSGTNNLLNTQLIHFIIIYNNI